MVTDIQKMIEAEAIVVEQFVDVLRLEQVALGNGSTDELPLLAEQKTGLATQLNTLTTQRNALLASQGFEADRAGIETWCAINPGAKSTSATWLKTLSLAAEARELNRLNGELIGIRMQYNAQALEILHRSETSLNLYGPDGQSKTKGGRRINDAV